jgi:Putative peptidoglycan binding domain
MSTVLMFDDVDVNLLPDGYSAYAGYVDGIYANLSQLRSRFPAAHILTIAVKSADVADCLDVEPGDANNAQAPAWFKMAMAHGVTKPCLYTQASNVDSLVAVMTQAGIGRNSYRLWTAHYGVGSHLCGPSTCKECNASADATQFTNTAQGKILDESVCLDTFFSIVLPSNNDHPTLTLNDVDASSTGPVHTVQTRLNVWHAAPQLKVDGDFGQATLGAVRAFQADHKLTVDGIVGPSTWASLLKTPPVVSFAQVGNLASARHWIVTWTQPAAVNGKEPTGYKAVLMDGTTQVQSYPNLLGPQATFMNLTPGKAYTVEVTANGGPGVPASAKLTFNA